jgi:hypothetical protein
MLKFLIKKMNTNIYVFLAGVMTSFSINLFTTFLTTSNPGNSYNIELLHPCISSAIATLCMYYFTIKAIAIMEEFNKETTVSEKETSFKVNIGCSRIFLTISIIIFILSFFYTGGSLYRYYYISQHTYKLIYSDDTIKYEGGWANNKKNGTGKYFSEEGSIIYNGEWKNGEKFGEGTEYYKNGEVKYRGFWKSNKWNGNGDYFSEKRELIYSGLWLNGQIYKPVK